MPLVPGNGRELLLQRPIERSSGSGIVVRREWERDAHAEDAFSPHARIHGKQPEHAAGQQTCAHQQHERERHAGHDETPLHPMTPRTANRRTAIT